MTAFDFFAVIYYFFLALSGRSIHVLREAFKGHLIDHEQEWLKMLLDRNIISHTYDQQLADKIYNNIKSYIPILRNTFDKLSFLKDSII